MKKTNKVAFIYEGESTEYVIFQNLKKIFGTSRALRDTLEIQLPPSDIIDGSYLGNIYDLYKTIEAESDIDTIEVIKERIRKSKKAQTQKKYAEFLNTDRDEISEIYLFFDCDPHHDLGNVTIKEKLNRIKTMLDFFDNETEHGKLYISYPMIEAIKDLSINYSCEEYCRLELCDCPKYKAIINERAQNFLDPKNYTLETWQHFIKHGACKSNCIIHSGNKYELPDYKTFITSITQTNILAKQSVGLLKAEPEVFILSAIPLFLLEDFGQSCWGENGILFSESIKFSIKFNECSLH